MPLVATARTYEDGNGAIKKNNAPLTKKAIRICNDEKKAHDVTGKNKARLLSYTVPP